MTANNIAQIAYLNAGLARARARGVRVETLSECADRRRCRLSALRHRARLLCRQLHQSQQIRLESSLLRARLLVAQADSAALLVARRLSRVCAVRASEDRSLRLIPVVRRRRRRAQRRWRVS